jgi:hypothetical protein
MTARSATAFSGADRLLIYEQNKKAFQKQLESAFITDGLRGLHLIFHRGMTGKRKKE